jgi:anti-sigma regulatory factor (Ser/Thr protein kinase)
MALLHKKLNVSENVNDVDLSRYITELSELVKDSYNSYKKKINLNINCEIKEMSIEKALPLGLIVVELVSNSMKHAFKSRSIGIITISIKKNNDAQKNILYYSDNGGGFNFNTTTAKGLGIEIIKGLIDQLDGTVETKQVKVLNSVFILTNYSMNRKTILLVEDDFLNRRFTKKTLAENGYTIFECKNAIEAFGILNKQTPDLIILDINLGEKEKMALPLPKI